MKSTSQPQPRRACRLPAEAPMVAKKSIISAPPRLSAPAKGEAPACTLPLPLLPLLSQTESLVPSIPQKEASSAMTARELLASPAAAARLLPRQQANAAAASDSVALSAVTCGTAAAASGLLLLLLGGSLLLAARCCCSCCLFAAAPAGLTAPASAANPALPPPEAAASAAASADDPRPLLPSAGMDMMAAMYIAMTQVSAVIVPASSGPGASASAWLTAAKLTDPERAQERKGGQIRMGG